MHIPGSIIVYNSDLNHIVYCSSSSGVVCDWRSLGCSAAVLERGHLNFVSPTAVGAACTASDHHKLVARENCN